MRRPITLQRIMHCFGCILLKEWLIKHYTIEWFIAWHSKNDSNILLRVLKQKNRCLSRDPLWFTRFRGYFFNYGPRFPYNLHSQAVCNLLLFFSSIVHRCWWLYYAWKYQYFFYSQWSRYRALLHFTNIISPIAVYILSVLLAVY